MFQTGNRVRFWAHTSSAGPGYHAFLVHALDRVAERDGGAWHDSGADGESTVLDDVGYFEDRDFSRLQRSMAEYLKVLANSVSARASPGCSCLSLPIGLPVLRETGYLTPTGFLDQDALSELGRREGDELLRAAQTWFPWWNGSPEAALNGIARSLLFHQPWHVPDDEDERAQAEFARAILERLPEGTRFGNSPVQELGRELAALLSSNAPDLVPDPAGYGYRRQEVEFSPFGGMKLGLPGYWHRTRENPGVAGFCFGDRSLHISSYQARSQGAPIPAVQILAGQRERQPASALWRCEWNEPGNQGLAWCEGSEARDGFHVVTALKAADGRLLHATITYLDASAHDWAREIAAQIRILA